MTVTLIPPNWVGIRPEANSGALLQKTPAAGVLAGTRFGPCISTQVFGAMKGASEPEAFTEVMVGCVVPCAGWSRVPEPVKVNVVLDMLVMVIVAEPLAPANAPVPPVSVVGKEYDIGLRSGIEKKNVKESLVLRVKVAVPCAETKSVDVIVALMVTLPSGVTVPVPLAEIVAIGLAPAVRLTLASDMDVEA